MKKKNTMTAVPINERTNPVLTAAYELMKMYVQATGAMISILDQNYMLIPEMSAQIFTPRNICLFCIKHQKHIDTKNFQDLNANPCRKMHLNAIRESYHFGGSCTYMCSLGFLFWTSPIYQNDRFAGALLGSGYLGTSADETCQRMHRMCGGTVNEKELRKLLGNFPGGEPRKIKSLAEFLLLCARYISVGSDRSYSVMKRHSEQQSALSANITELKNKYPKGEDQPGYPLEKERKLLEVLRRGDIESGKRLLSEIISVLFFLYPDQFRYIQYRAIELAVLISRIDISPGIYSRAVLRANNRYFKSIQESNNIVELTDTLYRIVDNLAGQISSFRGIQHAWALKKAEHFILDNFTRKISLEEIATASGFSAPYFSTIFKEEMGENLSSYLNRLRIEKACYMLTDTNLSLSKIVGACGFEDQSWFSKIFKHYAGISPGKYRNQGGKLASKIPKTELSDDYRHLIESNTGR